MPSLETPYGRNLKASVVCESVVSAVTRLVLFRTREKETSERRREMKAKETAVQFYKEKVTYSTIAVFGFLIYGLDARL